MGSQSEEMTMLNVGWRCAAECLICMSNFSMAQVCSGPLSCFACSMEQSGWNRLMPPKMLRQVNILMRWQGLVLLAVIRSQAMPSGSSSLAVTNEDDMEEPKEEPEPEPEVQPERKDERPSPFDGLELFLVRHWFAPLP